MLILGIDPGIGRCGWGIVEIVNSKPARHGKQGVAGGLEIVNSGCIETEPNGQIEKRLLEVSLAIEKLIKEHKPDVLAIEELYFGSNAKTAFIVGQARGVILLAAARVKIPIAIYTPLQVKIALTGYGRADKNQIAQMVKVILKLEKIPKLDDTSDALAVAITEAFSSKMNIQTKL